MSTKIKKYDIITKKGGRDGLGIIWIDGYLLVNDRQRRITMTRKKKFDDLPFDAKAMAEATAQMLTDPTNNRIAVIPDKDGRPVFITRE